MILVLDADQVIEDLNEYEATTTRDIDRQFDRIGQRTFKIVALDRSFGGQRLRRSIRWKKRSENVLRIFTDPSSPHASFVNDGTSPHEIGPIVAKNAKSLRFVIAGSVVFAKSTKRFKHPGTKATHFFDRATQRSFDQAVVEIHQDFDAAARQFNR